jgi:hypothetical protein
MNTFTHLGTGHIKVVIESDTLLGACETFHDAGLNPRHWYWEERGTTMAEFLDGMRRMFEPVDGWDDEPWWEAA